MVIKGVALGTSTRAAAGIFIMPNVGIFYLSFLHTSSAITNKIVLRRIARAS